MACARCGRSSLTGGVRDGEKWYCSQECFDSRLEPTPLQQAQMAYEAALQRVRENPTDPSAREAALYAGRIYAQWSRYAYGSGSVVTIFDEVALQNDLQAASAAAPASTPPVQKAQTVEQRLERLDTLKQKGLLSEQEYDRKRAAILDEL